MHLQTCGGHEAPLLGQMMGEGGLGAREGGGVPMTFDMISSIAFRSTTADWFKGQKMLALMLKDKTLSLSLLLTVTEKAAS